MISETIKKIKEYAKNNHLFLTKHCKEKLKDRNLSEKEIIQKLNTKPKSGLSKLD